MPLVHVQVTGMVVLTWLGLERSNMVRVTVV